MKMNVACRLGVVGLVAVGCGGDPKSNVDAATVDAAVDAVRIDAPVGDFVTLVGRDWSLMPGQETYRCRRVVVPADMYITAFRAVAPVGTHHTVVTLSDSGPLGDYDCNAGTLDFKMLYASGVGTDDLAFPAGVAIKVKAGQRVNINLHLFNTSDQVLTGSSGVKVKTVAAAQVTAEAEMFFGGTFNLNIPSGAAPVVQTGSCTVTHDYNLFGLWPHMHQYATHQKVVLTRAAVPMTLLDDAFTFVEQRNYLLATPLAVKVGDQIQVTCTYQNNSGTTIRFGDSSDAEMCLTGMYRYPVVPSGNLFECTEGSM
jgi:hypothetical protein